MKRFSLCAVLSAATLSMAHAEEIPVTPSTQVTGGFFESVGPGFIDPPVIARERITVTVLPETGVCRASALSFIGSPCPILRFPDGREVPTRMHNFSRPGPLTIEVDRLTYDFGGWLVQDYSPPTYEYAGEIAYRIWDRSEWAPCPDGACDLPPPPEVHPAFPIPFTDVLVRDFIDVE